MIEITTTIPPGHEEAHRVLTAALDGLTAKMDRLHAPGGMSAAEKRDLQHELGAANEQDAKRHLKWEIQRIRGRLELLDERTPRPDTTTDAAKIAAQARAGIAALKPRRMQLARQVLLEGMTGRTELLEETENRMRRLELRAERAELIVNGYPS